ncbi:MAG: methyltransferase domain-containing protein, partial [Gemmatimonadaceae bacterium]
ARKRLKEHANVSVREGDLGALPIEDESLDAALIFLVLHYTADPAEVLSEVHRVLKPDGRVLVVDMMPHERSEFRNIMGHVWQGFGADELSRWAEQAGLHDLRYHPLPADSVAKGPTLFAASARRPSRSRRVVSAGEATKSAAPAKLATPAAAASQSTKPKTGARAGNSSGNPQRK